MINNIYLLGDHQNQITFAVIVLKIYFRMMFTSNASVTFWGFSFVHSRTNNVKVSPSIRKQPLKSSSPKLDWWTSKFWIPRDVIHLEDTCVLQNILFILLLIFSWSLYQCTFKYLYLQPLKDRRCKWLVKERRVLEST